MAVRREKVIETSKCKVDARAEIYNCAAEVANDGRSRPLRHRQYDMSRKDIHKSWHGVDSYEEALDLLSNGYQPVVEELREELKVAQTYGPRFQFSNEVQGFLPVVPLALKGVPNSMIDMRIRPIKTKVLDIYYDMTANCDKDPEDFIHAGKILLGTILALEQQGYRFNLYGVQTYWDCYNYSHVHSLDVLCVKIKSSNSPLDLKRMSFPLTHPAFFRVIGFDWQGKSPITRYAGDGRGRAINYDFRDEDCTKMIRGLFGDNAIYLSCSKLIDEDYDKNTLKGALTNGKVA